MKNLTLLFVFTALLGAGKLQAQVNIAPTAVATQSSGGVTIYAPANYNDNIIVSCTSTCAACSPTPWGWVFGGTGEWIEYTWPTAQTFDKVVFYKANRPMSETMLQYWNGSAYVDIVKYNSAACPADSITFPIVTSTRLRFYGQIGAGNPNYREIQVYLNTPPCNGKPAAGMISGTVAPGTGLCKGSLAQLNCKGAASSAIADIKYQWQRRPSGSTGAWSNMTDAKDTSIAADTLMGWEYRMGAICTKTKDTGFTAGYNLPELPQPTVSMYPTGPVNFCAGDSVWLNTTNHSGGSYEWMRDGIVVPGWAFSDFAATTGGNYRVRVMVPGIPCPGYSETVKVQAIDPGFEVSITTVPDSIFCEGTAVTITGMASKPGVTYQWRHNNITISGATTPTYMVTKTGKYRVAASDGGTCPALSRQASFIMQANPEASITIPGGTLTACAEDGVWLNASTGYAYEWMRTGKPVVGWTDSTVRITESGIYSVKVRSANGCASLSGTVTVNILPSPVPAISKSGLVLSTGTGYVHYAWTRNGTELVAAGAGLSSLNLEKRGTYRVEVTDANGCKGVSIPVEAMDDGLGIGNLSASDIRLFPNPVQSKVFIQSPLPVRVRIEQLTGRVLLDQYGIKEADISGYADGIYLFTISSEDGMILKKEKILKATK